ncbi:girdin-like isoform X2 [Mizuhopecten yessoensis]|uniref:girdin-like isoform X2 n=1 Tax=Mizuhopecten yessoensis TaxID=6573 RepID=UPI000B459692|nr:girdin-like isoform X2 [Mizuhopecten yessoensis]
MAAVKNIMETPLVLWVESFNQGKSIEYADLYNGTFLNDVMQQIDPRPTNQSVNRQVDDVDARLHNWDILLRNIRGYFVEVLQQLLVLKLPNVGLICRHPENGKLPIVSLICRHLEHGKLPIVSLICRHPENDGSFQELKKAILLILGCAVQCERKEDFIDGIKRLDVDVQHAIVEHIKEVTDDTECVLSMEPTEHLETYTEKMFNHLTRVLRERDDLVEATSDLVQERDFYQSQIQETPQLNVTPPTSSPDKHHTVVELADAKARIRKLRQELEDKQELITDLKDDQEENKIIVAKLRNENVELIQDARSARSLRDELDILREKFGKVKSYESEITKMKEKLNELEFYKSRVDELREDNAILIETKNMLQEQLDSCHKRVETVIALENELGRYRQQVEEQAKERDTDRQKIQILTEENANLQFEKKTNMNESTNIEKELESARLRIAGMGGSLSNQLNETTNAKILRLELENQRLLQKVEEARESALIENTTLTLELEKENQRLAKKVEKLQESNREMSQSQIELEQKLDQFSHEREQLSQTLETVKESADRQVRELERENDHLTNTVETVRARSEQTNDAKLKDLERENKRMHETVIAKNQLLSKLEFENRQVQKSYNKVKASTDKLSELETDSANLEKENSDLHKTIATLQLTCDKFEEIEQENSDFEVENRKLKKNVESLQSALQKMDHLEKEHINLTVDNQKLQRSLESLRNSSSKLVELENDKGMLNREIKQLQKSLEAQRSQQVKHEQMELDLLDLDNENQRLEKSLEMTTKRLQQLEQDNTEMEIENEKLQKSVETLKVSTKRLHELEKTNIELDGEVSRLAKDKSVLTKEKNRLKQSIELKDSELDDLTTKHSALERSNRNLKQQIDRQKDTAASVKESEKENKELQQQSNLTKRTLAALREDLVNEKVKSQQMKNEMDRLTHDLERVGINKEKLVKADNSQDDSRYKALENMMEDALKKSMEIKEEKIHALESRLEESKKRNIRLQDEMRQLKQECESLKQRYEEESHSRDRHDSASRFSQSGRANNPTKEMFEVKDHLIQVERQNATFMAENKNLKSQTNSLNAQIQKLESQNSKLQNQSLTLQDQFTSLQSHNAKLQVENSTLKSECSTLRSQMSTLQSHLSQLEGEHKHLLENQEELQISHEQLVQDHEQLQQYHEQLASEYEGLISEHGSLKSVHKSMKGENKELKDQLDAFLQGREDVSHVRDRAQREKDALRSEIQSLGGVQMEYEHLREEHSKLLSKHEQLCKNYSDTAGENKHLKTENNTFLTKNAELKTQCDEYREQLHSMEIDVNSLAHKYDTLYQMNQKMEEDNKNLLMQIQSLLNSNHELLSQILNSKEHFAEEEKSYLEKMSDLRRQKERLEEKIMDHYKRQEVSKKNRGLGARIARRAAKIFVSRNRERSKSRNNLTNIDNSQDNTSQGSGDVTADHDSRKSERKYHRHGSAENLLETSALSKQSRSRAKSTTALNLEADSSDQSVRGAKSSDNLADSMRSRGDKSSSSFLSSTTLPGLGKPTSFSEDDDGGFRSASTAEGGNDMLTLEEFLGDLNEDGKSKSIDFNKNKDDIESKSSENSDNSFRQKRQAPPPPVTNNRSMHSIPDVAAVSHPDLNLSRMSRISTGSSGSGPESRPESYGQATPPHVKLPETSTPAQYNNGSHQSNSLEELNQFSPFPRQQQPHDFRRNTLGSTPSTATRTLQYSMLSSPGQSGNSPANRSSNQNRELPPTPSEAATDRLDRLTSLSQSSSSHNNSVISNASNFSDMSKNNSAYSPKDSYNYQSSQQHLANKPPTPRGYQIQAQGPNRAPPHPSQAGMVRSRQPPMDGQPSPQQYSHNGPVRPVPTRDAIRHVQSPGSRPNTYHEQNTFQNNSSGVGENRTRNSVDYSPEKSSVHSNGPIEGSQEHHYARVQRIERPKSVPPNIFNQMQMQAQQQQAQQSQRQDQGPIYSQPQKGRTPPVPPPRRNREVIARVSLVREPGQMPSGRMSAQPYQSSGANSSNGPINKTLPMGGMSRTVNPGVKSSPSSTSAAPRPMKAEENATEPNKNALWTREAR